MFTIKSPLKYFPVKVGDYSLTFDENRNSFYLFEKNEPWMGYNLNNHWQATEFFIEIDQGKGVCITTGLGLGILQSHLCLKENVTKVIVYEKSKDVIEMFHRFVEFNNFDISKLEIRNQDANNFSGEQCDCLFSDHFEAESEEHIINVVRNLSMHNNANTVWYWPAGHHFIKFALRNRLDIDSAAYNLWKDFTKINNLPVHLDEKSFLYLRELKILYQDGTKGKLRHEINLLEQRNNLLTLSKKLR